MHTFAWLLPPPMRTIFLLYAVKRNLCCSHARPAATRAPTTLNCWSGRSSWIKSSAPWIKGRDALSAPNHLGTRALWSPKWTTLKWKGMSLALRCICDILNFIIFTLPLFKKIYILPGLPSLFFPGWNQSENVHTCKHKNMEGFPIPRMLNSLNRLIQCLQSWTFWSFCL